MSSAVGDITFRPRKILAIKLRSMGDTVLMTAPLAQLREAFPDAQIHVAVTAQWATLLQNHPAINRLWPVERHRDKLSRAKAIARTALKLRRENFDCAFNFHASPSSATLAFASGARVRSIHFHGHKAKNQYSTVTVPGKGTLKPVIERDMDTLRALNLTIPEGLLPQLHLRPGEMNNAFNKLQKMSLPRPILAVGLGSSRPTKCWPVDRYAQLSADWHSKTGGGVVVITGPGEEALHISFFEALGGRGKAAPIHAPEVRELAAVLSQCSAFVGNDSGPKHAAVAVQTPTVTLFGPEHPFEWHPYSREQHPYFFVEALKCRQDGMAGMPPWCALEVCEKEEHRCMRLTEPGPVLEECLRVMRKMD